MAVNRFRVVAVRAIADQQSAVDGEVESGEIRKGTWVSFTSCSSMPVTGQVYRIGAAVAASVARQGQRTELVIGVEAHHLAPGVSMETSEDEVCAPAMLLTHLAPQERQHLPLPPDELVAIEHAIDDGRHAESMEKLRAFPTDPRTYHIVRRLMAKVHLDAQNELRDPVQALEFIREAYSMRGSADPDVNETLARALGENGDPMNGLRYLDRLYMYALDRNSSDYYARLIQKHRERFHIPDQWDVLDALGDVLFSTANELDIAQRHNEKALPAGAQVRKNRVGQLQTIADFVKSIEEIPEIEFEPGESVPAASPGGGWRRALRSVLGRRSDPSE